MRWYDYVVCVILADFISAAIIDNSFAGVVWAALFSFLFNAYAHIRKSHIDSKRQ